MNKWNHAPPRGPHRDDIWWISPNSLTISKMTGATEFFIKHDHLRENLAGPYETLDDAKAAYLVLTRVL